MRLLYRINNKWVQLFTDTSLDINNYLNEYYETNSDVKTSKVRSNLKIPVYYWSKNELASPIYNDNTSAYEAVSPNVIHTNETKQFVSAEEKTRWNNKVDRPSVGNTKPASSKIAGEEVSLTEGRLWYDNANDNLSVILNKTTSQTNKSLIFREPDNYRFTAGKSKFNGTSGIIITHNCKNALNNKVVPEHISITPTEATNGLLGEYYVGNINNSTFTVYNTGSGRTTFSWSAVFKTGSNSEVN